MCTAPFNGQWTKCHLFFWKSLEDLADPEQAVQLVLRKLPVATQPVSVQSRITMRCCGIRQPETRQSGAMTAADRIKWPGDRGACAELSSGARDANLSCGTSNNRFRLKMILLHALDLQSHTDCVGNDRRNRVVTHRRVRRQACPQLYRTLGSQYRLPRSVQSANRPPHIHAR